MSKLKELEKRLRDEPENLVLRVTVAGALREAGRHDDAVELYRSVAMAYRDQGRSQQAIAVCRSILEIAPDDVVCHALLAQLVAHHKGRAARDTAQQYGNEIVLEVGTPPEHAHRDKPPSIPPVIQPRTITPQRTPAKGTPATAKVGVAVPMPSRTITPPRRSSNRLDETPLPVPMPYHVADPTTKSLKKLSEVDMIPTPDPDDLPVSEDAKTRPGEEGKKPGVKGIASAARRISNALIATPDDISQELDTRQRPRIDSEELEKIAHPPPTVPVDRIDSVEIEVGEEQVEDQFDQEIDQDEKTPAITLNMRKATGDPISEALTNDAGDNDDPNHLEEDDGIPTLSDEDDDETTNPPRDTPLDLLIRTEAQGPLGSAFFQPLPDDKRAMVLSRFHKKSVRKGTTVIRQGEVGHSLIVVVKGKLEARVDRKGGSVELGYVGTGEYVGEGSLLARAPSPVHVSASTDCDLLLLPPRDFYEIAGAFPALWAELKDVAERRKRELEQLLKR